MNITDIVKSILNLIYPPRCAVCDCLLPFYEKNYLCSKCNTEWLSEKRTAYEIIEINGIIFTVMTLCRYSKKHGSIGKSTVLKLKSHIRTDTAEFIASQFATEIRQKLDDIATEEYIMTAVPRSKRGLRKEGFDQAELVAKITASMLGIEYSRLIENLTEKNQKTLDAEERIKNAKGAYEVRQNTRDYVTDRKIIIYDDVISTGSTLGYCIKALKENGAKKVFPICFARTEE